MQLSHASSAFVLRLVVVALCIACGVDDSRCANASIFASEAVGETAVPRGGAAGGADEEQAQTIAPPRVVLAEQSFVLGRIYETRVFEVPIQNGGDEPLVVSVSETSCGCLMFTSEQVTIPPGDVGLIELVLDPRFGTRGSKRYQTATLSSNDPSSPSFSLGFEYWISDHELIVNPKELSLIGDRDHREAYNGIASGVIVINDTSPEGSEILETSPSTNQMEVETWSVRHVDHVGNVRRSHRVRVTLRRGYPLGPVDEHVVIHTTNPSQEKIVIPIKGEVIGNVIAEPAAVFLGMIAPDTPFERSVLIRTRDGSDLVLDETELRTDIAGVDLSAERESASSVRIFLSGQTYPRLDYTSMGNRYQNLLAVTVEQPRSFVLPIAIKSSPWLGGLEP